MLGFLGWCLPVFVEEEPASTLDAWATHDDIAKGADCSSYTQYNPFYTETPFRPRTYGLQAVYRL